MLRTSLLITSIIIAIFISILCFCETSFAHKVTIFAYVEGGKVYTESYYVDGTKCKNSEVEVYNKDGQKVLTGKTDEKGEFNFVPPCEGPLKIVLNASMGHRAETVVSKQDLAEGNAAPKTQPETRAKNVASGRHTYTSPEKKEMSITRQELEKVLNEILDKKLHPIMKLLAESRQHGVSAKDVFAGLGYIFGIMGIGIYLKDIKKQGKNRENDK